MKVTVFSTKRYDQQYLNAGNARSSHEFLFLEDRLHRATAPLAAGAEAVCAFVNDVLDAPTLDILARGGTRLIVLRCAGFNQVDLVAAEALELSVRRVPAYSPSA